MRKLIVCLLLLVFAAVGAVSDEAITKWFGIPPNETALVVVRKTQEPSALSTSDGQNQLDLFSWAFDEPLIRQFRLEPGEYEVVVNGDKDKSLGVKLESGQLNYLQIDTEDEAAPAFLPATYEPIKKDVESVIERLTLKGLNQFVTPQRLEPAGKTLYFNTEPPFPIPKPGDPPPN